MFPYRRISAALVILLGASAPSCTPTLPANCGSFGFTPSVHTNPDGKTAAQFQLSFLHKGASCAITCNDYFFVQALKPVDLETGEILQPHDTQQDRTVTGQAEDYLNGWAIDRQADRRFGWYAVNDSFQLEPSGIPGEETKFGQGTSLAAQMHDTLSPGDRLRGKRVQVMGLTAAVSTEQGTVCEGKILGLKKWMVVYGHDESGAPTVAVPVALGATLLDQQAFLAAAKEWNAHLDDGRERLPWAKETSAFAPLAGGQGG